jgi:CRP/FNR family transcriptional regulator
MAYRIESGAICHSITWPDGSHEVIEFVFPGDIVGLGALSEHVSTAHALVDTVVAEVSPEELERAVRANDALAARLSSAMDREFEYLRARALQPGRRPVTNRVAAYLVAVARSACRTGETPVAAGAEGVTAISAMLDVDAGEIRHALQELAAKSLIAERDGALVILDRDGLELSAEG